MWRENVNPCVTVPLWVGNTSTKGLNYLGVNQVIIVLHAEVERI